MEAEAEAEMSAQLEKEAQVEAEARLLLAKKRSYIQELELDVAQRTRAAEDLKYDIEIVSQEAEVASSRAKDLQRQWQAMSSSQGPRVEQLESVLAVEEKEVADLERVAAGLEGQRAGLSEAESQRLWWLERVAELEFELRECRRQLEPVNLELGVLDNQLQMSARESQGLQHELHQLEAAYAAVGVDVPSLRASSNQAPGLEELDLILELCLAILPRPAEEEAPPHFAAPVEPQSPLALARRKPPLLPDNVAVTCGAPAPPSPFARRPY